MKYWRVGAVKVATEESSNLLSSKDVTMATEPQPTKASVNTTKTVGGKEGGREENEASKLAGNEAKHMAVPLQTSLEPPT